jgi:glycosyltransferase involved in cell wall biosynthesis
MLKISTDSKPQTEDASLLRNLMLFELSWSGHHAGYILHLIEYWNQHHFSGAFNIVVAPEFVQKHTDVVDAAQRCDRQNIHFVPITSVESQSLVPESSFKNRIVRSFQSLKLLAKYAEKVEADECLITYFDSMQAALATGTKLPCKVSGIYFRPTFHYNSFAGHSSSFKDRIQQWREQFFLSRAVNHPQFKTLYCLDPFVVSQIQALHPDTQVIYLPDPVKNYTAKEEQLAQLKTSLGIAPDRTVFLLFGRLEGRKGIHQLLEAVSLLPQDLTQKLCLLLVGPFDQHDKQLVDPKMADILETSSAQIIIAERFVPDHEIQSYFQISDVILAPYQRHVGMSAILVRAATAQKPVLASNYGLMGEVTRVYQLGLAINSTDPQKIVEGLTQFLMKSPDQFCNRDRMQVFAEINAADQFAKVIFSLCGFYMNSLLE